MDTKIRHSEAFTTKFPYNHITRYARGINVCNPLCRYQKTTKKCIVPHMLYYFYHYLFRETCMHNEVGLSGNFGLKLT